MAHDVVVIGGGNAALCAALAAREGGASVLVLEKAPEAERGGNSFFTAGGFRFAHQGLEDLRRDVIPDLSDEEAADHRDPRLHRRPVLRRHHAGDRGPLRSRPRPAPGPALEAHRDVDAHPGHPLDPHVQPPVLQGRATATTSGAGSTWRRWEAGRAWWKCSSSGRPRSGIEVRYGVAGHQLIQDGRGA